MSTEQRGLAPEPSKTDVTKADIDIIKARLDAVNAKLDRIADIVHGLKERKPRVRGY